MITSEERKFSLVRRKIRARRPYSSGQAYARSFDVQSLHRMQGKKFSSTQILDVCSTTDLLSVPMAPRLPSSSCIFQDSAIQIPMSDCTRRCTSRTAGMSVRQAPCVRNPYFESSSKRHVSCLLVTGSTLLEHKRAHTAIADYRFKALRRS